MSEDTSRKAVTEGILQGSTRSASEKSHFSEDIVTINVSGTSYELELDDVRRSPSSRLYKHFILGKMTSMVYKRPIQSFEAVLAYYQTGELHMPLSVCPGAFKTELTFWGLDPQIMSKCCYYRFLSHLDDQETLDRFHLHLFPEVGLHKHQMRWCSRIRPKLWTILDNTDGSVLTKIYFYICTAMVIMSVLALALSTLPYFRRGLTKCELEEMLGKPIKTINSTVNINDSCLEPLSDDAYASIFVEFTRLNITNESNIQKDDVIVNRNLVTKKITNKNGENRMTNNNDSEFARSGSGLSRSLFDFNFDAKDTVSNEKLFNHIFETLRPQTGITKKTVRVQALVIIDTVLLVFFTADLVMRITCCPNAKRYFLSSINVIDALVVLSSYAHMAINFMKKSEKYEMSNFDLLEIFQVLRVVRLLRLVRNVTGFKVLTFSLKVSMKDLLVLFLYLLLGVAIFANFIYFVENDRDFNSIPVGWWWAISTLTTVGYGDIVPKTLYGRMIGGLCAISGVIMMAVAIPVFVKTFLLLYAYAVLYKKSIKRPEDTHRYIHRQGAMIKKAAHSQTEPNNASGK